MKKLLSILSLVLLCATISSATLPGTGTLKAAKHKPAARVPIHVHAVQSYPAPPFPPILVAVGLVSVTNTATGESGITVIGPGAVLSVQEGDVISAHGYANSGPLSGSTVVTAADLASGNVHIRVY
jgi:hypothetical protein